MQILIAFLIIVVLVYFLTRPVKEDFNYWYGYYPWFYRPYYWTRNYWHRNEPIKPYQYSEYPYYKTYMYDW